MANNWEKPQSDRKQESFFSEREKRLKKKKVVDKPFLVQQKLKESSNPIFDFMLEWSTSHKFATLELAQTFLKKVKREWGADRRDIRIIDVDGNEYPI